GDGPTFLEVRTYRFMGHFEGDPDRYRDAGDRELARSRDALAALREQLVSDGIETGEALEALRGGVEAAVSGAAAVAKGSPRPGPAEIGRYVYPEPRADTGAPP